MFYFVLMLIALTNLALGYAVAAQFGLGWKPACETEAALAKEAANLPSFAILGSGAQETPLDQLPAAKPVEPTTEESSGDVPNDVQDKCATSPHSKKPRVD